MTRSSEQSYIFAVVGNALVPPNTWVTVTTTPRLHVVRSGRTRDEGADDDLKKLRNWCSIWHAYFEGWNVDFDKALEIAVSFDRDLILGN